MNKQTNDHKQPPWYKQKWPWFIISFPLLTVVAGVITYQIAAEKPHSMVKDNYFKEGLAINESLAKKTQAKKLGLKAIFSVDKDSQLLTIQLSSKVDQDALSNIKQLTLTFSHPTQEKLDKQVLFSKLSNNEYVGQLPNLPQSYWHVHLNDQSDSWELKSRWHFPESQSLQINPGK